MWLAFCFSPNLKKILLLNSDLNSSSFDALTSSWMVGIVIRKVLMRDRAIREFFMEIILCRASKLPRLISIQFLIL